MRAWGRGLGLAMVVGCASAPTPDGSPSGAGAGDDTVGPAGAADTAPPEAPSDDDACDPVAGAPDLDGTLVDITPEGVADPRRWGVPEAARPGGEASVYPGTFGDLDGDCVCEGPVCTPDCTQDVVLSAVDRDADGAVVEAGRVHTMSADGTLVPHPTFPALCSVDGPCLYEAGVEAHPSLLGILDLIDDDDPRPQVLTGSAWWRRAGPGPDAGWVRMEDAWILPPGCGGLSTSPQDVGVADVDRDGWLDLVVNVEPVAGSCDALPTSVAVAMAVAPGRWEVQPRVLGTGRHTTDSFAFHWQADGRLTVSALGQYPEAGSPAGVYVEDGVGEDGRPRFVPTATADGTLIHQSPMGAMYCDLDGDGGLEHLVSTGRFALYGEAFLPEPFPLTTQLGLYNLPVSHPTLEYEFPWGLACVDLDKDGRPDVLTVGGDDAGDYWDDGVRFHLRAWWNPGRCEDRWRRFRPWSADDLPVLGVGTDEHGLMSGDLDGDGDADLITSGHQERWPRVLRNDVVGHSLTLQLRGTTSNLHGLGATLRVTPTGPAGPQGPDQVYQVGSAGTPRALAVPQVSPGLGDATAADVEVVWPSGLVTVVRALDAGRVHHLTEPALLSLSDPDRHLPATPGASVDAVVCPHRPGDGAIDEEATVTLTLQHHGADDTSVQAPVAEPGGCWRATVLAGDTPGEVVLDTRITYGDGTTLDLGVRPRLWVDPPGVPDSAAP